MRDQVKNLETLQGSFSQTGMWNVKSKLFPRPSDPPMAKLDSHGNLITSQEALKQLYLDTYTQRLKHREIKDEFKEVFVLKRQLWNERLENVKTKISSKWKMMDIENIIKKMKKNLTSDPSNMINELLLPGVMGSDLKLGLLSLVYGIKKKYISLNLCN